MARSSRFRRFLLPGFAFKAVVIGGGYATGRELVEFFFPAGPLGGLAAMAITAAVWSLICALTFAFAYTTRSFDYRTFFQNMLGKAWWLFEVAFVLLIALVLSVFGAAAGEISMVFGLPSLAGTLLLALGICICVFYGNDGVEQVFQWVTVILYGVFVILIGIVAFRYGGVIINRLGGSFPVDRVLIGGATYASYNVVGAVVILQVVRHMTSRRDALIAGIICGPVAIFPAVLFFLSMLPFYPEIAQSPLPSEYMLSRLAVPGFALFYQFMIFVALLESGTGLIHSFNERLARFAISKGRELSGWMRVASAVLLLISTMLVATQVGLVALIAKGYTMLAWTILFVFIIPLVLLSLAGRLFTKATV